MCIRIKWVRSKVRLSGNARIASVHEPPYLLQRLVWPITVWVFLVSAYVMLIKVNSFSSWPPVCLPIFWRYGMATQRTRSNISNVKVTPTFSCPSIRASCPWKVRTQKSINAWLHSWFTRSNGFPWWHQTVLLKCDLSVECMNIKQNEWWHRLKIIARGNIVCKCDKKTCEQALKLCYLLQDNLRESSSILQTGITAYIDNWQELWSIVCTGIHIHWWASSGENWTILFAYKLWYNRRNMCVFSTIVCMHNI